MERELILAVIMQMLVDYLLILGTAKLLEQPIRLRMLMGALAGGGYSVLCLLSGSQLLQGFFWHTASILLICLVSFGVKPAAFRPSAVYFLLRLAMNGILAGRGSLQPLFWALVLWAVWLYGIHVLSKEKKLVPVVLQWEGRTARLTGLIDTGNSLRDPVTGRQVLVVGADVADALTGLTRQQLSQPVETITKIPGFRLIPYKTVGQSGGMLLAMQLRHTKIGDWTGSTVVAFAPQVLDESGKYQALIGGM